ncbi:hypothetical protein [Variovorax sp. PBL-E5]|uniref:hypothetical protein n=1 Tax=Variovorax sp. PBL-E5 TaxID=434014 RepID=UPI0013186286|nr:hypothetical protein [Variovorax sp. PBL-E5]VTU37396.1 hypothetical protein E5CHR_04560 [Variovorax sp. PBL-E5]
MTDAAPTPEEDGPLQDDALRRALLHAPDHAAVPDWRLRKTILQKAHEAVAVSDAVLLEREEKRPWWRAGGWTGGSGSRMPWNAAFATVLLATLVTVLWQRESVPDARPDSERQVAAAPPRTVAPSPAVPASASPAPATSAASQAIPAGPPSLLPELEPVSPPPPLPPSPDASDATNNIALFGPDLSGMAKQSRAKAASPTPNAPAPSRAERARKDQEASMLPRFAGAPPAAPAAAPAAGLVAPGGSAAGAARAAPPSARTDATEPPTFEALSQWTRITIAQRGGATRSLTRAEAGSLDALMGSAAISAAGAQPLAGAPEWRITLERGKDVLAVFELGRNQVRWREGRSPPATGAPSAPALDALRSALGEAVQPPPDASRPEAAKPEPAPPPQDPPPTAPPRAP